jgi:hypothetical protein
MNEQYPTAEFLVICRGEWDSTLLQKEKQNVIDQFYAWFDELVDQGKIKRGQRLTSQGNTIGQKGAITDGPFGESKEVIGGYWFVLAQNLDEAAHIVRGDPVSITASWSKSGRSIQAPTRMALGAMS